MTNEEIKTLIEQEAERHVKEKFSLKPIEDENHPVESTVAECKMFCKNDYIAGATFYEQSILPEVLKEKDEEINEYSRNLKNAVDEGNRRAAKIMETAREEVEKLNTALHQKHLQACEWKNHADNLQDELSQLQSKMEEEKRRAEAYVVKHLDSMLSADKELYETILDSKLAFDFNQICRVALREKPTYELPLKSTTQSTESGNLNKQ